MDTEFYNKLFDLSMQHRVEFRPDYSMEKIQEYIKAIGRYNAFEACRVLDMIDKIDSIIPEVYHGENNPNNGNRLWKIDIGREYSPVIYINIEVKALGKDRIHPDLQPIIINECKAAARKAAADEISHEIHEMDIGKRYHYKSIELRFWWD